MIVIAIVNEMCPLRLTRPNYLGAVDSHSAAPGERLQFWGQRLGEGQRQELTKERFRLSN